MVQWVKVLTTMLNNLSSIPGPHMVKREIQLLQIVFLLPCVSCGMKMCPHKHILTYIYTHVHACIHRHTHTMHA